MENLNHLPGTALTCLNGLKHGGASQMLFLPHEQPQDFYALLAESFETHKPATTEHAALVTDTVLARWYLWRRQRVYYRREHEIYGEFDMVDGPTQVQLKELETYDRYCTSAERKLDRALTTLQRSQKATLDQQKWQSQLESQKQRFDLDLLRFDLRREQDARLAPQIEAEAKLAAAEANTALELAAQKKESQKDTAKPVLVVKNGEAHIFQTISVRAGSKGNPIINAIGPSNDTVRAMINNADRYFKPPTKVVREFLLESVIPSDYLWVRDSLPAEQLKTHNSPTGVVAMSMSFEEWLALDKKEAEIFAAQGGKPREIRTR
jgi:hypothetical protein